MRTCKACGGEKPLSDYYDYSGGRGKMVRCKVCVNLAQGEYQKRPEIKARRNELARSKPRYIKAQRLWTWYRLRPEQFQAILDSQDGKCAVCRTDNPGGMGTWHVDHDHTCCAGSRSCGKCVRGLLCSRCNPMIGMAKDDPKILAAAVDYLVFGGVDA